MGVAGSGSLACRAQPPAFVGTSRRPPLRASLICLEEKYRARLHDGLNGAEVVYLIESDELPLSARKAHFMKADMLQSQFEAFEEPQNALVLDASM